MQGYRAVLLLTAKCCVFVTLFLLPLWSLCNESIAATKTSLTLRVTPDYWPKFGGKRHVELLDGLWESSRIGSIKEPPAVFEVMDPNFDPTTIRTYVPTSIPSCVDNTPPGYLGYRGVSFFRRTFDFDLTNGARIQFQACSFYCRVWVNQREIGSHHSGYVAFSLDIPPQRNKTSSLHELFVLVDNRFNETTAPLHTGGDFWHYGGILRSVELHALPPPDKVWPWRLYVFPVSLQSVKLQLVLMAPAPDDGVPNVLIGFDDGPRVSVSRRAMNEGRRQLKDHRIADLGVHQVPNPMIWSTNDPQLHTVQVEIDGAILSERFGLRIFDIDHEAARIQLNGDVIKLVGWSHHTQWPDTAASPTNAQLDADIRLLKEGGANFVRGAHYPQDPRWLDRLDENGFIMWEETLGPGVSVNDTMNPIFRDQQRQQVTEMLDNAMNHASVAIWAFFNEGPSNSEEACALYQECSDMIHARDSTRFVSYAGNKRPPSHDKCYAVADIISMNAYPGWYEKREPYDFWPNITAAIRSGSTTSGKPFLISETGAGGIFEWGYNTTASLWTLEYQQKIVEDDVDIAISNTNISGIALWHFFDFKVNDRWENSTHCDYLPDAYPPTCGFIDVDTNASFGRPGGLNHKGSIDFWRRKKPVFDAVAKKFHGVSTSWIRGRDRIDKPKSKRW